MSGRTTTRLLPVVIMLSLLCSAVQAFQGREHLTEKEIDMVKEAQVLDKRIDVFIKAAERRMLALNGAGAAKQSGKDAETWGDLPTGSRAELIGDLAKIFDEAITNIDDVSTRDANNALIPKALRKLSATATRIVDQLKPVEARTKDDAELNSFEQLAEYAESIVQAANKLPAASSEKSSEKKSKSKTDKETN
jgi:hypothetical protein